ncbi:MAG: glycosyltransferase family 4 protein [Armatimonadota bacterium]|nr:glycosyltransferase family 4 protein [Armatimonadota bacterium]
MIKILSLVEATTVTGPAKNLLEFYRSTSHRPTNGLVPGSAHGSAHSGEAVPVNVSLVTFHRAGKHEFSLDANDAPNEFVAAAREQGIDVNVIPERFRFDTRVIGDLYKVVDRYAPDIIETHNVKSHFLMRLSGLGRQYPWVAFHHGYTMTDAKMRLYNQLDRWSLRAPARVITVSEAFARDLTRAGVPADRISALHNAIHTDGSHAVGEEDVCALRMRLGIKSGESVILAVGRLSREKAHVDLVAALNHVRRWQPEMNAKLVIVGEGPERRVIEQMVTALGLSERVTLVGQVKEVGAYYALADVLVLPSLSEGSPLVLLEAMAAGLPIVATAVGGVPEMVAHNESALLVGARDPQALAQAIGLVLTDVQLARALATNARTTVSTRHAPESHRRCRIEIYRELVRPVNAVNIAGAERANA